MTVSNLNQLMYQELPEECISGAMAILTISPKYYFSGESKADLGSLENHIV